MGLAIAALVKQIPMFEAMTLGADGRLVRDGLELEMNAYCRRAVAQAVELAREHGGTVTRDHARPARRRGRRCARPSRGASTATSRPPGVLVTDPAFAGLRHPRHRAARCAAALARRRPVRPRARRPQLRRRRHRPGRPRARRAARPAVRHRRPPPRPRRTGPSTCAASTTTAGCRSASTSPRCSRPPSGSSTRARSIPRGGPRFRPTRIRTVTAADLGAGPWGQAASPTRVGRGPGRSSPSGSVTSCPTRRSTSRCAGRSRSSPSAARSTRRSITPPTSAVVPPRRSRRRRRTIGVLVEPDRPAVDPRAARRGGEPRRPRRRARRRTSPTLDELGGWGADEVVGSRARELGRRDRRGGRRRRRDRAGCATTSRGRCSRRAPRGAARSRAAPRPRSAPGLTGDAVGLELDGDRLHRVEARVRRPARRRDPRRLPDADGDGARRACCPSSTRACIAPTRTELPVDAARPGARARPHPRRRPRPPRRGRPSVIGVGQGVAPEDYPLLEPLRDVLGAELAATRKVTDQGWLPRARQIGITGRSIAPRLFVVLGASGKFNHMVGVRAARSVLAINTDPERAGLRRRGRRASSATGATCCRCSSRRSTPPPSPTLTHRARRARRDRRVVVASRSSLAGCDSVRRSRGTTRRRPDRARRRSRRRSSQAACAGTLDPLDAGHAAEPGARRDVRARRRARRTRARSGSTTTPATPRACSRSRRTGALQGIYPLDGRDRDRLGGHRASVPGPKAEHAVPLRRRHRRQRRGRARTSSSTGSPEPKVVGDGGTHPLAGVDALTLHVSRRRARRRGADGRPAHRRALHHHQAPRPAARPRSTARRPNLAGGQHHRAHQGRRRSTLPRIPFVDAVTAARHLARRQGDRRPHLRRRAALAAAARTRP